MVEVDHEALVGRIDLPAELLEPESEIELVTAHQVNLGVDEVQDVLVVFDRRTVVVPLNAVEAHVPPLLLAPRRYTPIPTSDRKSCVLDGRVGQVRMEDGHQFLKVVFLSRKAVNPVTDRDLTDPERSHQSEHRSAVSFNPPLLD